MINKYHHPHLTKCWMFTRLPISMPRLLGPEPLVMISMVIFLEVLMEFLVVFVKNQQTKVQSQGLQDRDHQSHHHLHNQSPRSRARIGLYCLGCQRTSLCLHSLQSSSSCSPIRCLCFVVKWLYSLFLNYASKFLLMMQ